jgi:polar amino acid transport system substrate-binding protein
MHSVAKTLWRVGLCCLLLVSMLPVQARPVLRLAANYWEPYTGESLVNKGIASEIVVTALNRAGVDVTIDIMPWKRVLATAYNGDVDGIVAIWSTRDRRDKLLLSNTYMSNELVFLYMSNVAQKPTSLADASGLTVGIGSGYDYSDEFLSHKNFKVESVPNVMQNLLKLTRGRVGVVLEDRLIAKYSIQKYSGQHPALGNVEFSPDPVLQIPLYFALNPKTPNAEAIIRRFNHEIMRMKQDGTLRRILSNPKAARP